MTQNPIPRALSILFTSQTRALLMGGQACILQGAAEFSRDIDIAILVSPANLDHLRAALATLQAELIFSPCFLRTFFAKAMLVISAAMRQNQRAWRSM